jgi:rhodanese-related sulfurtransferase
MCHLRLLAVLLFVSLPFLPVRAGNFHKNISVAQADTLMQNHRDKKDLLILDVRTPAEFAAGHIVGAVNIDFWGKDFEDSVAILEKGGLCLVYCTSGVRSGGAMKKMRKIGFKKIYNMNGGMFSWRAAGLPVVSNQP